MTGSNGVEVEGAARQNGGRSKERTARELELLKQMRERIAVLDPESKVSLPFCAAVLSSEIRCVKCRE